MTNPWHVNHFRNVLFFYFINNLVNRVKLFQQNTEDRKRIMEKWKGYHVIYDHMITAAIRAI